MKKSIISAIIILTGVITSFFFLDLIIGISNIKNNYLISSLTGLSFIIAFYLLWNAYSLIISKKTKKDIIYIKNKDILTFVPLLLLSLFPLRYLISFPQQFMEFIWLPSAILLMLSISLIIFLKLLFLDISLKKVTIRKKIIYTLAIIFFVILSYLAILKHQSFYSTAYDLSIYDQAVYGLTKGKNYVSVMGYSIFGDHIEPILFVLTIFYFIYSNPITLLIIQSLALSLAVIPLFFLTRRKLKDDVAALTICLSYFLFPAFHFTNLFDFHPMVLSVPFIISAIYFLDIKKYCLMFLSLFFAGISKEYLPFLFIPFGIYIFLKDKRRLIGITSILIGICWFYLNFEILTPILYKGEYEYVNPYFGENIGEAIKTIITKPIYSIKFLLRVNKLVFIALLIGQVGFGVFSIFAVPILLLGISEIAIPFLYWHWSLSDIVYHHQSTSLTFILISSVYGISFLNSKLPKLIKKLKLRYINSKNILLASSIFILSTSLLAHLFYGPFTILYDIKEFNPYSEYAKTGHKFISMIPKDVPVAAPNWILPHLSQRENAYTLNHFLVRDVSLFESGKLEYPQYILVDLSEALIDLKRSALKIKNEDLNKLFNNKNYGIVTAEGTWLLLKRGEDYNKSICKIRPFLNRSKYPYLNITMEKGLIEKC